MPKCFGLMVVGWMKTLKSAQSFAVPFLHGIDPVLKDFELCLSRICDASGRAQSAAVAFIVF